MSDMTNVWTVTVVIRTPENPVHWDWPVLLDEDPANILSLGVKWTGKPELEEK